MGLKGVFKFLLRRLFEAFLVTVIIVFLPNLPPYAKFSEPFKVTPAKTFEGKLALNEKLNDIEVWHKGDFFGPEAFADYKGELYTSIAGGDVVKLTGNHITPVVNTGKPCKGFFEERICGRPLGMQFSSNGELYVSDPYYGIFKVNVQTGEKQLVVNVNQKIEGVKPKLPNSVALASNGDIFWTDSSSDFLLEDGVYAVLADPSGRLIHYNAATKKNTVLLDKLHFANGVALSEDEEFVIVAETVRSRIHRYYLTGPKKGSSDIFIDGLPGLPDNLKSDGHGGFLVPLVTSRDADHPSAIQAIGPFPLIRKLAARGMAIPELIFAQINKVYPNEFCEKAVHFIGHFTSVMGILSPARTTILRVSQNGEIVDSLHTFNKKVGAFAEAHIFNNALYLGSPFNDYIGRIPLSKIGWEHLSIPRQKREVPVEARKPKIVNPKPVEQTTTPKPTTTTPKPTTTTPKPTTTTPKPTTTTTTPKPTTTTPKLTATTTTPKPATTTTPKPTTTTPQPTTTTPPKPSTVPPKPSTAAPVKKETPPPVAKQAPPVKQAPPPVKQQEPVRQQSPPPSAGTAPPPTAKPTQQQTATPKTEPIKDQPKPKEAGNKKI